MEIVKPNGEDKGNFTLSPEEVLEFNLLQAQRTSLDIQSQLFAIKIARRYNIPNEARINIDKVCTWEKEVQQPKVEN